MRMYFPIGYKFILGFVVVVAAVAFFPFWVKLLGYSPEMTNFLTFGMAMTCGLILGWIFSRSFTKNISLLTSSTEAISQGDLTKNIVIKKSHFPDETHDMAVSVNRMVESLREIALLVLAQVFLGELGISKEKLSQQDWEIYKVARLFGECTVSMPKGFVETVKQYIALWQSSPLFMRSLARAQKYGYGQKIREVMLENGMPPQFFYLALKESGFEI